MSRIALVTGGSRGIGRAISLELASRGNAIAVNYAARSDAADEVVSAIQEKGGDAAAFKADVSRGDEVDSLFSQVEETFGRPDILVNNAGITSDDLLLRLGEDQWDRVMDVNLKSAYFCSKAASRACCGSVGDASCRSVR